MIFGSERQHLQTDSFCYAIVCTAVVQETTVVRNSYSFLRLRHCIRARTHTYNKQWARCIVVV